MRPISVKSAAVYRNYRVVELCNRLTDLSDVIILLEVKFLCEVINRLFEAQT